MSLFVLLSSWTFAVRSSEPLSGGDVCEFFRQTAAEHRQTVIIRILQWVFFKIIFFLDLKKVALIAFEKRLSKNGRKSPSENLRQGFFLVNLESESFSNSHVQLTSMFRPYLCHMKVFYFLVVGVILPKLAVSFCFSNFRIGKSTLQDPICSFDCQK